MALPCPSHQTRHRRGRPGIPTIPRQAQECKGPLGGSGTRTAPGIEEWGYGVEEPLRDSESLRHEPEVVQEELKGVANPSCQ